MYQHFHYKNSYCKFSKWDGVVIKLNGKKGGKVHVYVTGQIKFRLKYNLVNVGWIVSLLCLLALIIDELGYETKETEN